MDDRFRRLRAVTIGAGTTARRAKGGRAADRPPPLVPVVRPAVDTSDADLFRAAVVDARPLPDAGRIPPAPPRVRPLPLQRWADDRAVLTDSLSDHVTWEFDRQTGEQLAFKRDGVSPQVFRKLRRGHWILQGEIDLHGMTRDEARPHLAAFLSECIRRGARCIRVIHGKGLRSRNREPVLKAKVAHWLAQRDEVLAFCEATPRDGGGGAMFVLLKAREQG
ncbi:MAG: Smr/MutS family protein [Betaproteobacteria bacterium]|jgi:DNA-nicking Smr family endonuclease